MKIHYIQRTISTATATTAATGYPATNISTREIRREWRSTSGGANTVTINLGSSVYIDSLWLQAVNFASATISYSTDDIAYTTVGTMTTALEHNGRRKGKINVAQTAQYLRVVIASGSPTEGYWTIGAAYVFGAVYAMPQAPVYGMSFDTVHPVVSRTLPNGRTVVARTGPLFTRLSGEFDALGTQDVAAAVRLARDYGIVGVDMEFTDRLWMIWPMEYVGSGYDASIAEVTHDETSFALEEVV